MITSDKNYVLSSDKTAFEITSGAQMNLSFTIGAAGDVIARAAIISGAGSDNEGFTEHVFVLTRTQIDAETGSGTGESAQFYNAAEKAVKTVLAALNSGVTFTIS